jgi:threonylcarbamoyladenosine tRNA methylthiotransferase MtaB
VHTVAIRTLGCKVNRTESEALAEALLGGDCLVVEEAAGADLVVVNTCTVTGEADAKARKEVRRALAACAGPVVVTGCLASLDAEGLRALGERVIVEADRSALAARVRTALGIAAERAAGGSREGDVFRTRVMLKVQDGCDHRCSYCIVPDARGNPRSVPADRLIDRVRELSSRGTREIVLTGINIGRYSDGIGNLSHLIGALAETGVARLRLSSIEPLDLDEEMAGALARAGAHVAPHLHVPLQSGCDRTLIEMRRGYTTAEFAAVLARLRAAIPGLAVTTDVIVGFPGETDEDFAESCAFVESCGFTRLHVFRYSRRAGTPAAGRSDQIEPAVIAARAAGMRALSDRLYRSWLERRNGTAASVLVERVTDDGAFGTTEDGLHVSAAGAGLAPGDIVAAVLRLDERGAMNAELSGRVERVSD